MFLTPFFVTGVILGRFSLLRRLVSAAWISAPYNVGFDGLEKIRLTLFQSLKVQPVNRAVVLQLQLALVQKGLDCLCATALRADDSNIQRIV